MDFLQSLARPLPILAALVSLGIAVGTTLASIQAHAEKIAELKKENTDMRVGIEIANENLIRVCERLSIQCARRNE